MQPVTVEGGAREATLLSPEQLHSLTVVATVLGKGVEEVTGDVTCYLNELKDVSPGAQEEAARKAV
jgi:hypothetical protein